MHNEIDFIYKFQSCLTDRVWLPFVSPPYQVEKQALHNWVLTRNLQKGHEIEFYLSHKNTGCFGHVKICSQGLTLKEGKNILDPSILVINGICSGHGEFKNMTRGKNYGRELVRRAVLFADQAGYDYVKTSIIVRGAVSFWFGLGFLNNRPLKLDWRKATKEEKLKWEASLTADPCSVWDFAQTNLGKYALDPTLSSGILNLRDERQRRYAFTRLCLEKHI